MDKKLIWREYGLIGLEVGGDGDEEFRLMIDLGMWEPMRELC